MVRGRKPNPSAVQRAKGAYKKDPQRENKQEPTAPKGRPKIPKRLSRNPVAHAAWESLCDALELENRLSITDGYIVEKLAMVEAFIDVAWNDGDASLFNRLAATHRSLLSELGLTASSRTKVTVPEKKDDGEEELAALQAKLRSN
jgi:phage terminase small subunit